MTPTNHRPPPPPRIVTPPPPTVHHTTTHRPPPPLSAINHRLPSPPCESKLKSRPQFPNSIQFKPNAYKINSYVSIQLTLVQIQVSFNPL
ncbi:hypothetical protein QVD17_25638 [Tagetes erecta]|uniref:Uncharacterized protein n=1 Tax=Tagetes erecta TaxID=13708 RepID=A0AAD8NV78_TARER|nr:hypothetical protein QVD17_25638 [Tagetes erecta]